MNSKLMKQLTCLYFINSIFKLSRSEEHTSELQSQSNLVCRLLLEKKKATLHLYVVSDRQLRERHLEAVDSLVPHALVALSLCASIVTLTSHRRSPCRRWK